MKKALISIARPICRFISSTLWQLVWLVPLWFACWYGKIVLPQMIRSHFNVDQLRDRVISLEKFAELMKDSVSVSNPSALVHYISAQLTKFSTLTKLNTLEMTSNFLQTLCLWALNLIWVIALIYAVIRTIRLYRSKSEIYTTATMVATVLKPQFLHLQQEIESLRNEIQTLKEAPILIEDTAPKKLTSHD